MLPLFLSAALAQPTCDILAYTEAALYRSTRVDTCDFGDTLPDPVCEFSPVFTYTHDVQVAWTATFTGQATIQAVGEYDPNVHDTPDTIVQVSPKPCEPASTATLCGDRPWDPFDPGEPEVQFDVEEGQTYFFTVSTRDADCGTVNVLLRPLPPNDIRVFMDGFTGPRTPGSLLGIPVAYATAGTRVWLFATPTPLPGAACWRDDPNCAGFPAGTQVLDRYTASGSSVDLRQVPIPANAIPGMERWVHAIARFPDGRVAVDTQKVTFQAP